MASSAGGKISNDPDDQLPTGADRLEAYPLVASKKSCISWKRGRLDSMKPSRGMRRGWGCCARLTTCWKRPNGEFRFSVVSMPKVSPILRPDGRCRQLFAGERSRHHDVRQRWP